MKRAAFANARAARFPLSAVASTTAHQFRTLKPKKNVRGEVGP